MYRFAKIFQVLTVEEMDKESEPKTSLGHPNKMFRFPSPRLLWWWVGRSGKKNSKRMNTFTFVY